MFRFTIRELLWLTLVMAVGLAWWIDSHQLGAKLDQARNRATKWRGVAGALEHVLAEDGCIADWTFDPSCVWLIREYHPGIRAWTVDLTSFEPSLQDD